MLDVISTKLIKSKANVSRLLHLASHGLGGSGPFDIKIETRGLCLFDGRRSSKFTHIDKRGRPGLFLSPGGNSKKRKRSGRPVWEERLFDVTHDGVPAF